MNEISDLKDRFKTALNALKDVAENVTSVDVDALSAQIENLQKQLDAESAENHTLRAAQESVEEKQEEFETNKASLARANEKNAMLQSEIDTLKSKRENDLREVNDLVDQLEPLLRNAQ